MNLPHNIDAEKAILGSIMLDNRVMTEVSAHLQVGDFYHGAHRSIFAAMIDLSLSLDSIDAVTVGTSLLESKRREIGGVFYLSTLSDNIGVISGVSAHIKKVKELSIRRNAIIAARRIIEACEKDDMPISSVVEQAGIIREVESIGGQGHKTVKLASGIGGALDGMKRFSEGDTSDKVPMGIYKIDRAMRGGMIHGALYLLGAPSGAGKTTLLQNVAVNCARHCGPVLFVSPEMATWELSEREIIRRSGVTLDSRGPWVRFEERTEAEAAHIRAACDIEKEELNVYCIDDIDVTMSDICAKAKTISGLKLVIIDYAQEVADMSAQVARYLAVGDVGKDAIRLGKQIRCPVLIASQVNVNRKGAAVEYSFRESSKLHHKAHTSMIMEVKRFETPNKQGYFDVESTKIFAMKNRSGPMFSVEIDYNPATFMIGNMEITRKAWVPTERIADGY